MMRRSEKDAVPGAEAWMALRRTTEALAHEIAHPADNTPDWSEDEWLIARAAASIHGMAPLLARTSRWRGPAGWHAFLGEQLAHTTERHSRIQSLLTVLDDHARENGIALVALKGAALHAMGLYQAGERPMADIDLLSRSEDAARTARMLEQRGFNETHRTWRHQLFERVDQRAPGIFGEHAGNVIKIELHTRIHERLPRLATEITEHVLPLVPCPGINPYPSRAALLMHLVLHAAGAMCCRTLRLLHMNDIARLSALMTAADWDEFLGLGSQRNGGLWWAFSPLTLVARYFRSVPERILAHELLACSQRLRRMARQRTLTDVSMSNPRIEAFPGIAWARTVSEVLGYVKTRVLPDAESRALRSHVAETYPAMVATGWGGLSHGQLVWRWLTERPPRPEPLFAVRTALGQRSLASRGCDQRREISTSR